MRKTLELYFTGPRSVELRSRALPTPAPDQVVVKAKYSAISSGTELLIYRGQAPMHLPADETLPALRGGLEYPLKYGYAMVGQVGQVGAQVDAEWLGESVFLFHPHATHAVVRPEELVPLPKGCSLFDAVMLPTMETAVNLVMDGQPVVGERVLVVGQGVVGLFTTAILGQYPVEQLVTVDPHSSRREVSRQFGATKSLTPEKIRNSEGANGGKIAEKADLSFELSGSPEALNDTLALTGYSGRVVIGSWYGNKKAALNLGGRFHRSRIRIISSQVSTIDPRLQGRWSKQRRLDVAWNLLQGLQPASSVVTHELPIEKASTAYNVLDQQPEQALQVVFSYD